MHTPPHRLSSSIERAVPLSEVGTLQLEMRKLSELSAYIALLHSAVHTEGVHSSTVCLFVCPAECVICVDPCVCACLCVCASLWLLAECVPHI